jgi:hypothetical protein
MKTLVELCTSKIISKYSFFKNELSVLPIEIKEPITKQGDFIENYQTFRGKIYPKKQEEFIRYCDWGSYKL